MICSPPKQLTTQILAQYFTDYVDYVDMRAYLQDNSPNLNDKIELDQYIGRCTHALKLFNISRDNQKSTDNIILQQFLQGSLTNTLCAYLRDL